MTGQQVRSIRRFFGETQTEFARRLGFSSGTRVSEIENGRTVPSKQTSIVLKLLMQRIKSHKN